MIIIVGEEQQKTKCIPIVSFFLVAQFLIMLFPGTMIVQSSHHFQYNLLKYRILSKIFKRLLPSFTPLGYYFRLRKLLLVKYLCAFCHLGIGYFMIPTGLSHVCTVVCCKLLKIILDILYSHP